jgi:N-acyl-D-amino-acid deacylase
MIAMPASARTRPARLAAGAAALALLSPASGGGAEPEFDLLIAGGRIVDGSGNPWFAADLAVREGRIAALGRIAPERAAAVLDARGRVVAPGFIDVHTHIEGSLDERPTADNLVRMGVTTAVTGNCGYSELPLGPWFAQREKDGISINVASLVGHNSVRLEAMGGSFDRAPTGAERERMRELVAQAMREGAVGLSTGLEYTPGTWASLDEIAELARESARRGGLYATHMRNEDETVEAAVAEALEVGRRAGCPVQISHFKISSRSRWGASAVSVGLVEEARAHGEAVTVDQYVYTAGSTGIGILFPAWALEGDSERLEARLRDPDGRARVREGVVEKARRGGFDDLSFARVTSYDPDPSWNGMTLAEITLATRHAESIEEQAEQAIEMLLAGGAGLVLHKMSDADVDRIFRQPFTMIASDGGVMDPEGDGVPHPRSFGNNARVLEVYVRERGLVSLEEAVRKMSSLPAQTFGLWERGLLRPGMAADVVVFDPETVASPATFEKPRRSPIGIDYVLVNGRVVVERGHHTGARPGVVLRGPGAEPGS